MTTAPYAPTGYPYPVADHTQAKLSAASQKVKTVFDVFAVLILIFGALAFVGLLIAAGAEHSSYQNDYYNYSDETGAYVVGAFITLPYTALLWAGVKFYGIIAGYINWRTKP